MLGMGGGASLHGMGGQPLGEEGGGPPSPIVDSPVIQSLCTSITGHLVTLYLNLPFGVWEEKNG